MRPLKLTARSTARNDQYTQIAVFQNGRQAGVLTVEAEQEGAVLAAINSHAALVEACRAALDCLGPTQVEVAAIVRAALAAAGEKGATP